ncbi:HAD family phosphatase [Candidatus Babeliales bacterium]|nr:HAD family phosphatase [Candidatus Babeliales bacterium]
MKYKAIIFDMDGTIITTESIWDQATKDMLKQRGKLSDQECQEILNLLKGASLYTTCNFIKNTFDTPESVDELIEEKQKLAFSKFDKQAKLIEGFDQFFQKITSLQLKTAIATNSNTKSLNQILKLIPLHNYFKEHIYSIDLINKIPKPDPAIYFFAAEQLNIDPKDCIAIEDSAHGITAAQKAGMLCIAINTGKDRQAIAHADHIIEHYNELMIETFL